MFENIHICKMIGHLENVIECFAQYSMKNDGLLHALIVFSCLKLLLMFILILYTDISPRNESSLISFCFCHTYFQLSRVVRPDSRMGLCQLAAKVHGRKQQENDVEFGGKQFKTLGEIRKRFREASESTFEGWSNELLPPFGLL